MRCRCSLPFGQSRSKDARLRSFSADVAMQPLAEIATATKTQNRQSLIRSIVGRLARTRPPGKGRSQARGSRAPFGRDINRRASPSIFATPTLVTHPAESALRVASAVYRRGVLAPSRRRRAVSQTGRRVLPCDTCNLTKMAGRSTALACGRFAGCSSRAFQWASWRCCSGP